MCQYLSGIILFNRLHLLLLILCQLYFVQSSPDFAPSNFTMRKNDVLVTTSLGPVVGRLEKGVQIFLGIPFAEPPIHHLRFRPSKPKLPWSPNILLANRFSSMCLQSTLYSIGDVDTKDEDCLYLNVWAPTKHSKMSPAPVMLWIYGGGFIQGGASSPAYYGERLASRGIVVVSCNYRLGALGFLVSTTDGLFGNYGLHDQKLAMLWVRDNILTFGGDPDKVTLFGESAGAMSIGLHLLDLYGKRLFRAVILQSNPLGYKYRSVTVANFIGEAYKELLDCEDVRCLQSESADELIHVQDTLMAVPRSIGDFFTWGPVVTDGNYRREVRISVRRHSPISNVSVQQPLLVMRELSRFNVPVILGTNSHEGNVFVFTAFPTRINRGVFQLIAFSFFRGDAARVLTAYAKQSKVIEQSPFPDYRIVLSEIIGDYLFRCPNRLAAMLLHDLGSRVFLYEFVLPTRTPGYPCCNGLACHTAELPYVFEQLKVIEEGYSWNAHAFPSEVVMSAGQGKQSSITTTTPPSSNINSSSSSSSSKTSDSSFEIISDLLGIDTTATSYSFSSDPGTATTYSASPAASSAAANGGSSGSALASLWSWTWLGSSSSRNLVDSKVAKLMADYWTTFATFNDPNGQFTRGGYRNRPVEAPHWPSLSGDIDGAADESTFPQPPSSSTNGGKKGSNKNKNKKQGKTSISKDESATWQPFGGIFGDNMAKSKLETWAKMNQERYLHMFAFNDTSEAVIMRGGDCLCEFWNKMDYKF